MVFVSSAGLHVSAHVCENNNTLKCLLQANRQSKVDDCQTFLSYWLFASLLPPLTILPSLTMHLFLLLYRIYEAQHSSLAK